MKTPPKNRLLFVTYYYPPAGGVGLPGAQRAVKFVRHLEKQAISILTVAPELYPSFIARDFPKELPIRDEKIHCTSCYDPFEFLLGMRGVLRRMRGSGGGIEVPAAPQQVEPLRAAVQAPSSAPSLLQRVKDFVYDLCHYPDGASGWVLPAVLAGRKIVRQDAIDTILATGMPWSALVIAWLLHLVTGVKFVVDFRDPWIGNPFHQSKGVLLDAFGRFLERSIVKSAALVTVNTDALREEFLSRYPDLDGGKFVVVTNGFDPDDFADLPEEAETVAAPERTLVLAHAGFLYGRRDPAPFFAALEQLVAGGRCSWDDFLFLQIGRVELDYDFHERYRGLIERGVVKELGQLPFGACLKELQRADVLLLIQPSTKTQVPSKLYDYLCLKRQIVTISPLQGALGRLITRHRFGDLFDESDVAGIARRVEELLALKREQGVLHADYPQRDHFNVKVIAALLDDHLVRVGRS